LLILSIGPIIVVCILGRINHPLGHPYYRARFGSLYHSVDTVDNPLALMFTPLFMVRRILFALFAIVVNNVLVQLFVTIGASFVLVFFYATVWPMDNTVHNVQQLGNEIVFLWCLQFMLVFTDYTTDPEKRHKIGFVYLMFIGVATVLNLVLIGYTLFKQAQEAYRNRKGKDTKKTHNKKKKEARGIEMRRRGNIEERLYYDDEIP